MESPSCLTSPWGESTFCGFGSCDNGTGKCVCNSGWEADRSFYKADNCYMPQNAMIVVEVIVGVMSLLAGLYGLSLIPKLKREARRLATTTSCSMFMSAAYMLAHGLEGHSHEYAASTLALMSIYCLSCSFAIALYSLLKPIYRFAGGQSANLKALFIRLQVGEGLSFIACLVASYVELQSGDDLRFSYTLAASVICVTLHLVVVLLLVGIPTWNVVKSMTFSTNSKTDRAAVAGGDTEANRRLVKKVKTFIRSNVCIGPIVVAVNLSLVVVLFAMGSIPFMWVFYFLIIPQLPILELIQLYLARPRSASSPAAVGDQFLVVADPNNGLFPNKSSPVGSGDEGSKKVNVNSSSSPLRSDQVAPGKPTS